MCIIIPCRYLFTEWEDQEFGSRASAVHGALVNALSAAGRLGEAVWTAIRKQTEMMTQLAYITKELKVRDRRVDSMSTRHVMGIGLYGCVHKVLYNGVICRNLPSSAADVER